MGLALVGRPSDLGGVMLLQWVPGALWMAPPIWLKVYASASLDGSAWPGLRHWTPSHGPPCFHSTLPAANKTLIVHELHHTLPPVHLDRHVYPTQPPAPRTCVLKVCHRWGSMGGPPHIHRPWRRVYIPGINWEWCANPIVWNQVPLIKFLYPFAVHLL